MARRSLCCCQLHIVPDLQRKHLHLPIGGFLGRMGTLVLGARLTLSDTARYRLRPSYHLGFQVGTQAASLSSPWSVRLKPRVHIFRRIGLEVCEGGDLERVAICPCLQEDRP